MRVSWKVIGLAGVAGVAATGVVAARKRRSHRDHDPDELHERLQDRLAGVSRDGGDAGPGPGDGRPSP